MRFTCKLTAILLLLCCTASSLWAQERKTPIMIEQITYLMTKSSLTDERMAQLVDKFGIAFPASQSILEALGKDGAGPRTLEAVSRQGPLVTIEEKSPVTGKADTTPKLVVGPDGTAPAPQDRPNALRVGGDVQHSKLIKRVEPIYPKSAKEARLSGIVLLQVTTNELGSVEDVQVIQGHPFLSAAAAEAVQQWVYEPTLLNGEPVAVVATVTVNFSLR